MLLNSDTLTPTPTLSSDSHVTVRREIASDLDTPVSVYLKLTGGGSPSFLLESVTGGEQVGRYSFIGVEPKVALVLRGRTIERHAGGQVTTATPAPDADPLEAIRAELSGHAVEHAAGLPRFVGGMVGYLGYETVQFFEPRLNLPHGELPGGIFLLADTIVAFDHTRGHTLLMTTIADALMCAEAGADLIGLNFNPRSPRYVTVETARAIASALRALPQPPTLVGVFVNEPAERMLARLDECGLDLAQMSGDESRKAMEAIGERGFRAIREARQVSGARRHDKSPRFYFRCQRRRAIRRHGANSQLECGGGHSPAVSDSRRQRTHTRQCGRGRPARAAVGGRCGFRHREPAWPERGGEDVRVHQSGA